MTRLATLCLAGLLACQAVGQEITVKLTNEKGQVSERNIPDLPAFQVLRAQCGWESENRPLFPFQISFTSPLDRASFRLDQVRVDPPIPHLQVSALGDLELSGHTRANTRYMVTLDASLQDVFGRKLGRDVSLPFEVGEAWPLLLLPGGIVTRPELPIYTQGLADIRYRVFEGKPKEFAEYKPHVGAMLWERSAEVSGPTDRLSVTPIELPARPGYYVVEVDGPKNTLLSFPRYRSNVQVTHLGTEVVGIGDSAQVWVTDLEDGHPVEGARVSRQGYAQTAETDELGTAVLTEVEGGVLRVEKGSDQSLLDLFHLGRTRNQPMTQERVFFDARSHASGVVQLRGWFKGREDVDYQLNDLARGSFHPDRWGGVSLDLPIPQGHPKNLELKVNGQVAEHFGLDKSDPGRALLSGDQGGVLASKLGPEVIWEVTTTPVKFIPKGFDDFHFGVEMPPTQTNLDYTTRLQGNPIRIQAHTSGRPTCWQANCTASCGNVSESSFYLIHPGQVYVGLKAAPYIESGQPLRWEAVSCDPTGQPVAGVSLEGVVQAKEWVCQQGHWTNKLGPARFFFARTDPDGMAECQIDPMPPGSYRITVRAQDQTGRPTASQCDLTVTGKHDPASRSNSREQLELIALPDRLLVQSPLYPARGRLVASDGSIQIFEQTGSSVSLPVAQQQRTEGLVEVVSKDQIVALSGPHDLKNGIDVRVKVDGDALRVDVGAEAGDYSGVVLIHNYPYTWGFEAHDQVPELERRSTRETVVRDALAKLHLHRSYGNAGITTTLAEWDVEWDPLFPGPDLPSIDVDERFSILLPMFHTDASGHARIPFSVPPGRYRATVTITDGRWHFGKGECRIWKR